MHRSLESFIYPEMTSGLLQAGQVSADVGHDPGISPLPVAEAARGGAFGRMARRMLVVAAGAAVVLGGADATISSEPAEAQVADPAQGSGFIFVDINDTQTGNVDRCTLDYGAYGGKQQYDDLAAELAAALATLQNRQSSTAKGNFKKILENAGVGFEPGSARCNHIEVAGDSHPRAKEMARFTRRLGENVTATAESVDRFSKPITRPAIRAADNAIGSLDCGGGWEEDDGCEPYTMPYMVMGHDRSTNRNFACYLYTKGPERTDNYRKAAKAVAARHQEVTDDYSQDLEDYVAARLEANGGKYNPTTATCQTTQL